MRWGVAVERLHVPEEFPQLQALATLAARVEAVPDCAPDVTKRGCTFPRASH